MNTVNNPGHVNLRERAREWIQEHPSEMALLLQWARELGARHRRFGVSLLVEKLRWEGTVMGWEGGSYKISNNYRAYIARWLVEQDDTLKNLITLKSVHY